MDVYPVQELQDALGVHKGKEIAISRDVLTDQTHAVEVVAHEIAHALGAVSYTHLTLPTILRV